MSAKKVSSTLKVNQSMARLVSLLASLRGMTVAELMDSYRATFSRDAEALLKAKAAAVARLVEAK